MFATIELQKQAAADRYHHQLHPKPWVKSPEEAALAVACSGALDPNRGRFWGEFFPSRGLWSMSGWCRGYWSSQGRVEKGWNWVAECNIQRPSQMPSLVVFIRHIISEVLEYTQESVFLFTKPSGKSAYFLCPAAQR